MLELQCAMGMRSGSYDAVNYSNCLKGQGTFDQTLINKYMYIYLDDIELTNLNQIYILQMTIKGETILRMLIIYQILHNEF